MNQVLMKRDDDRNRQADLRALEQVAGVGLWVTLTFRLPYCAVFEPGEGASVRFGELDDAAALCRRSYRRSTQAR
jgi:hypothetical protein